ncbi:PspC domain-containing protein [Sphingomonas sp. KRR8]|uniref:PspC domain-containing protein n=1 Tax=Sphingomonas sp. KRR8 TaxID=2942996 RepID=UPI002021AE74|nr:PspC domain-containing protein [Sphingomonas sp. KRR8]URD60839.1 PspC domain-containing protein [Sphingomonas sp. KRR8]
MTSRIPFALDSRDKKLLGVCSGLGRSFNIDPTFIRVGFVAAPLLPLISLWNVIVIYMICAAVGAIAKGRLNRPERLDRRSEFERMSDVGARTSIHDLRTKLDATDRRLMAIDDHLHSADSDALAREIEALRREDKKTEKETN